MLSIQQQVSSGSVLIRQQSYADNLYIVLDGTLSATIKRNQESALASIFAALEDDNDLEQEIANFSTGEVLGEMSFLNISPSATAVKAQENSLVLALPCQKLLVRLQQDLNFASRFYRAIAMLLSARLQGLISHLGYGRGTYRIGQRLSQNCKYDDEIDSAVMDNLTLGGARFNWMLRRLKILS
ncbi:cyclic nucleotide-binding domain-containing protein [Scytonema sp. UIC 10036]|uniref:cyclic nucleotide-binding domain-containing protein n=1 Tax=Scytonema sp. UIC 10036 TaxID=2304196 RepID=UPI00325AD142